MNPISSCQKRSPDSALEDPPEDRDDYPEDGGEHDLEEPEEYPEDPQDQSEDEPDDSEDDVHDRLDGLSQGIRSEFKQGTLPHDVAQICEVSSAAVRIRFLAVSITRQFSGYATPACGDARVAYGSE